jgi:hypothetical protein
MNKKYQVIKDFKGSTTGANCIIFNAGMVVDVNFMGAELVNVAIKEEWIIEIEQKITGVQAYINSQSNKEPEKQ